MKLSQDRVVLGALVLSESAWLYAALAVGGAVAGKEGSPLGWLAIVVILAAAVAVTRLIPADVAAVEALYLGITLLGAAFMYVVVATQVRSGGGFDIDPAWIIKLFSGLEPDPYAFRAVTGILVGVAMWVRGITLAKASQPARSLGISFSLGTVALALAVMLDSTQKFDLGIASLVFIFFGAGLAGLSAGSLRQSKSAKAKAWPRIIGGMIVALTLIGALFTLISRDVLSYVTSPITTALGFLAKAALVVILAPVGLVFSLVYGGVEGLFGRDFAPSSSFQLTSSTPFLGEGSSTEFEPLEIPTTTLEDVPVAAGVGFDFVQILEWLFLGLLAVAALIAMYLAIRRVVSRERGSQQAQRESIESEGDYASDFADLLWKILPDRLRGRKRKGLQAPDGPPGIVEVFRIYYRMLKLAERRGLTRLKHQTTTEFQGSLQSVVAPDLARLATYCFNRACYGYHSATDEQLAQMRLSLKQSASR